MSNDIMKSYDYYSDGLFDFTDFDFDFDEPEVSRRRNASSEKSIGNSKKSAKNVKSKKASNINKVKAIIGSAILALSVYGGVKLTNAVTGAIEEHADTKNAIIMAQDLMTERLIDTGSAHYEKGGDFSVKAMTVEDYSKLDVDTPEELFALMQVIDDDTELDNMARSMSYIDMEDNVCRYTDFSQFLRVNSYYNEDGKADIEVFENLCENSLLNSYRDGTMEKSFSDGPTMGGMSR